MPQYCLDKGSKRQRGARERSTRAFARIVYNFERRRLAHAAVHGGRRSWGGQGGFEFVSLSSVCVYLRLRISGFEVGKKLHRKLLPLFKDLFIEPNPAPVKTALGWRGAMSGEVRLPLCEMSEANQARLRKTVEEFEQNK